MSRNQLIVSATASMMMVLSLTAAPVTAIAGNISKLAVQSQLKGGTHGPGTRSGLMCPTVCETISGQTVCYTDCRP